MVPDLKRIENCSACGAPIVWVQTSTGKAMPVDARPVPDGNIQLFPTVARKWLGVVIVEGNKAGPAFTGGPRERYKSHFATCPQAAKFRKPAKTGGRK